ncbi:hypothetical protein H2200_009563 [Cladophialophora chaetospira]|uniref:Flavoprotein oxygenase n=1 Tax=Cladophialophora chaetospira TaxID=386627 RepID=A0AA38X2N6_9EURO|nr:hypothetical protein H2200_009563 [Cladophialophora chaetospira]
MASSPLSIEVNAERSAFQRSSPLSLRQQPFPASPQAPPVTDNAQTQTHDYNFSGAVYDETSGAESEDLPAEEMQNEVDPQYTEQRVFSGCSSISSFPASISQHLAQRQEQHDAPRTPTTRDSIGRSPFGGVASFGDATTSPRSLREYVSPFRHPSSVRALQMKDEIMSETHSVLRHPRRTGSQISFYSQRSLNSAHTSPTKRSSRSHRSSPSKGGSNLKKEFPLVLLHCTLLPPKIRLQPGSIDDSLILDSLPEEYKQRWIALRNKLADVEISSRGVLIPHPREDMGMLEQRLLESLELEKPRIRHDHYFQSDDSTIDSGFESAGAEEEADPDGSCDIKCPDCGSRLHIQEVARKWEVKVFAANGLMRAGAWAAAWQEMEKVDVEINVWLPEDIRQELEDKLALLVAMPHESVEIEARNAEFEPAVFHERRVHGESGGSDPKTNTTFGEERNPFREESSIPKFAPAIRNQGVWAQFASHGRAFSRDTKNVLLGLLSLLVLFFTLSGSQQPNSEKPKSASSFQPISAAEVLTTTITSTSLEVSTTIVTAFDNDASPTSLSLPQQTDLLETTSTESPVEPPMETTVSVLQDLPLEDSNILEAPQAEVGTFQSEHS